MPDYEHQCTNSECAHEWEDTYSIMADPPTICPQCQQATAKRVISLGAKGQVELTGEELKQSILEGGKQLQRAANKNANVYANLLGESKYHDLQTRLDRRGR